MNTAADIPGFAPPDESQFYIDAHLPRDEHGFPLPPGISYLEHRPWAEACWRVTWRGLYSTFLTLDNLGSKVAWFLGVSGPAYPDAHRHFQDFMKERETRRTQRLAGASAPDAQPSRHVASAEVRVDFVAPPTSVTPAVRPHRKTTPPRPVFPDTSKLNPAVMGTPNTEPVGLEMDIVTAECGGAEATTSTCGHPAASAPVGLTIPNPHDDDAAREPWERTPAFILAIEAMDRREEEREHECNQAEGDTEATTTTPPAAPCDGAVLSDGRGHVNAESEEHVTSFDGSHTDGPVLGSLHSGFSNTVHAAHLQQTESNGRIRVTV